MRPVSKSIKFSSRYEPYYSRWKPLTTALLFSEAAESQKNGISVHSKLTMSIYKVLMFLLVKFI